MVTVKTAFTNKTKLTVNRFNYKFLTLKVLFQGFLSD